MSSTRRPSPSSATPPTTRSSSACTSRPTSTRSCIPLADVVDPETGWGIANDTYAALEQAEQLGQETWFKLGDKDLATHLLRTRLLREGKTLSQATQAVVDAFGVHCRLLPMTDDRVRTVVTTDAGDISFQEYFVRRRQQDDVRALKFEGADEAQPAPGVIDAITKADAIIVAPSNPLVSIGPVLAVPGVREALVATKAKIAAVSPIIGGRALKGPADRMLVTLGHESSAVGVAKLYASFLDVLVLDDETHAQVAVPIALPCPKHRANQPECASVRFA